MYAFGPGNRNEFDIAVDIAYSEYALAARFKVGVDSNAVVMIETLVESLECLLRRKEADLYDDFIILLNVTVGQLE